MLAREKRKDTFAQWLYILAHFIFNIKYLLDATALFHRPSWLDQVLIVSFIACFLLKMTMQTYTFGSLVAIVVFAALCAFSCIQANYFLLLLTYFCMVAIQDVNLRTLMKVNCATKAIALLIHVVAYIIVYYLYPSMIQFNYRLDGAARHTFFLGHANMFMAFLAWTCFEYIFINYKKIHTQHLAFIWLINYIFYRFTDSNTALIVLTLVIFLVFLEKHWGDFFERFFRAFVKYAFPILSVFFIGLTVAYTSLGGKLLEFWNMLNNALTGRLMYGAYAYDLHGFTLLGRTIDFPAKSFWRGIWLDNIIFDNTFIWMFILYGTIYLIIISVFLFYLADKLNRMECIFMMAFILYAIMENYVVNAVICFPLLLVGKYTIGALKQESMPQKGGPPLWQQSLV